MTKLAPNCLPLQWFDPNFNRKTPTDQRLGMKLPIAAPALAALQWQLGAENHLHTLL